MKDTIFFEAQKRVSTTIERTVRSGCSGKLRVISLRLRPSGSCMDQNVWCTINILQLIVGG